MQPEWIWAKELRRALRHGAPQAPIGKAIGCAYVLYDFDEEPLYVGKSTSKGEPVGTRISRHLLGRRADAVAKGVFPPFEVRSIEIFFARKPPHRRGRLTAKESAAVAGLEKRLYRDLVARAERARRGTRRRSGVRPLPPLNEKPPSSGTWAGEMPASTRFTIVTPEIEVPLGAREVRIERWAETIRKLSGSLRVADSPKTRKDLEGVLRRQLDRVDALI